MYLNKYKWIYRTNTKMYKMHAILTYLLLFCCRSKTILDSCPYLSILALHWYPHQINGHRFEGKEGDYIRVPERLLDVPDAEIISGKSTCELVQFIEYSSQQWFINENNLPALKNKVIYYYKDLWLESDFSVAATLLRMHLLEQSCGKCYTWWANYETSHLYELFAESFTSKTVENISFIFIV